MLAQTRSSLAAIAALALACAGPPAPSAVPASDLIAAAFEGQVEPDRGGPVLVSTATEEVRVVPAAIAEELRAFPGRTVTLHGWIVDEPQDALVMVVTRFEIEGDRSTGSDAREAAAAVARAVQMRSQQEGHGHGDR
jgi:hypothetical protein